MTRLLSGSPARFRKTSSRTLVSRKMRLKSFHMLLQQPVGALLPQGFLRQPGSGSGPPLEESLHGLLLFRSRCGPDILTLLNGHHKADDGFPSGLVEVFNA